MDNMKKHLTYLACLFVLLPATTFAFSLASSTFGDFVTEITSYVYLVVSVLWTLAFLVFSFGLIKVIIHSDNAKEVGNGRSYIIWGVGAMFVLVAIYGIISFMQGELGITSSGILQLPE